MRGTDHQQSHIFSYLSPEQRVRKDHPLRAVRAMVDEVLGSLSPEFDRMYAREGRPSIAPEKLLRAQLLQMLYSVHSERLLMEEIDYSVLFRWFVGLNLDEEVWDATTFTKNRDRLLEAEVAKLFLWQVVEQAQNQGLTSDEHFTVDGTLLEAWAGAKSFQRKDGRPQPPDDRGNPTVSFHGERRSNQTHDRIVIGCRRAEAPSEGDHRTVDMIDFAGMSGLEIDSHRTLGTGAQCDDFGNVLPRAHERQVDLERSGDRGGLFGERFGQTRCIGVAGNRADLAVQQG